MKIFNFFIIVTLVSIGFPAKSDNGINKHFGDVKYLSSKEQSNESENKDVKSDFAQSPISKKTAVENLPPSDNVDKQSLVDDEKMTTIGLPTYCQWITVSCSDAKSYQCGNFYYLFAFWLEAEYRFCGELPD